MRRARIAAHACASFALARVILPGLLAGGFGFGFAAPAQGDARIGDLTIRGGEVPVRLAGYGLVVGLDGTGDRSFGVVSSGNPTVRSVVNLLRRFDIEIPSQHLRLRNVAAVLVTAETSPYLRSGGRFEVQVSALGDATSLRGGTLWITPLVTDPGMPPIATAQGPLYVEPDGGARYATIRGGNSGRIPQGGLMEVDPTPPQPPDGTLLLRQPDLGTASRIAEAVNAAHGEGSAVIEDPGTIRLTPPPNASGGLLPFLAAVDTLRISLAGPARLVINSREGTVVAGGDVRIGPAVISHRGITVQVGEVAAGSESTEGGLVRVAALASAHEIAAGLRAAGARPDEVVAIFEGLHAAGAMSAQVVIR